MSASMRQGLTDLLVRRTEQGRAKARRCIEAWQNAIAVVQQAERMAECEINLPTEQIKGVQQAVAQVDTANYVTTVYLDNTAVTGRNAVISTAIGALQEEIKHRESAETMAKQELQNAITERDNAITAAEQEQCVTISRSRSETKHIWTPNFRAAATIGALSGITVFFFARDATQPIWSLFVYGLFGWLTLPVLLAIVWGIPMVTKEITESSRKRAAMRDAKATCQKAVGTAEKRLRELRPVLEERIRRAEAHRKKAQDALRWIEAQARTTI